MHQPIIRAALVAFSAGLIGVTGCQSNPPQQTNIAPTIVPSPAVAPAADPLLGTPEALTAKTQAWTRDVEPFIASRMKRPVETPSTSDFPRPEELSIGPAGVAPKKRPETPVTIVPIEKPTVDATQSSANRGSTLIGGDTRNEDPRADIAAANAAKLLADSSQPRRITSTPAPAIEAKPFNEVDAAIARHLRDYPKDVWAHLDFQLAEFLKDKPVPQLAALSHLQNDDRELISAVMDGLTNLRNLLRSDNNMPMSKKAKPILDVVERIRAQADLVVPVISLCKRVDGFGVYESIEPARFIAMKEHPIIVYCEVENIASHMNDKKQWESKLSQEVVLYTETGLPVWQDKTENITDFSKSQRHDFFIVKKTRFPANITLGRYLLKVTVVDQNASRVAEATMPVQFVSQ